MRSIRPAIDLQQRVAVGGVAEDVGPIEAGGRRGLDQQVGEADVVGVGRQVEATGQLGGAEREVALRVRAAVVHRSTPKACAISGVTHSDNGRAKSSSLYEAGAERLQPVAELSLVERGAAARRRWRCSARADAGAAHPRTRTGELAEQLGEVLVGAFVGSGRGADQQRAGREAVGRRDRSPAAADRDSGSVPKRSCSAIHPSTQPGTVTDRMSWRNGIST